MNYQICKLNILCAIGASIVSVQTCSAASAAEDARYTNKDDAPLLSEVAVIGKRASLSNARAIKQQKLEIVDAIVAEEIGKLPDQNVTDALSRVTGVQILRDRGEGAGVAIRGLTQIETTVNGREVFTAGTGRAIDLADVPSEMLAAIEVYKTTAADKVEGGVGGTIDLRMHRPFDFEANRLSGTARLMYGDLVKRSEPQLSMLASSRWNSEALGEFGLLLDAVYQKRAWREDSQSAGSPVLRNDIVAGQSVLVPNGTSETVSAGRRERSAFDAVLQWRPTAALELYAEGSYVGFKTLQDSWQINTGSSTSFVAGSPVLFPGTNNLQQIHWTNAPVSILSFARDSTDETRQFAVGGKWTEQTTTVKADISHTRSSQNLYFAGTTMKTTAADAFQQTSMDSIGSTITGSNLLDAANYQYTGLLYRVRPYDGSLTAGRVDVEQLIGGETLDKVSAGLRMARRDADNGNGLIFGDAALGNIAASSMPGYTQAIPYGWEFFHSGSFLAGSLDTARNVQQLYADFGNTNPLPTSGAPLSLWRIREQTNAAYLMADMHGMDAKLDSNVGMRVVQTRENVSGNQSVPATGSIAPLDIVASYTDYLPSLSMRYAVDEQVQLRAAYSKSITRPDFNLLSPSLTLNRNTITPSLNQGSAGNPALKPVRANNYDVAIERYFGAADALTLTGFYKQVDGFVGYASQPEVHGGDSYQVTRPYNNDPATIRGLEFGYQQFYETLPGWMRGLGMRATYTYVDSATPSSVLGKDMPLPNLSRHSYNLIGIYEQGDLSARIAYNWRDKFLSRVASFVGLDPVPVYTRAYAWLDASLTYRLSKNAALTLEGSNLLRTVRSSYYGDETRPASLYYNDRQFAIQLTVQQ